jgi:tellurite resistance protein
MSGYDSDVFDERRRALENEFFAEQDKKLLDKMRSELRALEARRQLTQVTGIGEEKVLQDLIDLGIQAEALTAVGMIPMIEVAWADGAIGDDERAKVLKFADANGIKAGTAGHMLLQTWLKRRPDPKLLKSWKAYVAELVKVMPPDSFAKVRDMAWERCNAVARASGGILGVGKISKAEEAKLAEIAHALRK